MDTLTITKVMDTLTEVMDTLTITEVMPFLDVLAQFRGNVRDEARLAKAKTILEQCDKIRDDTLPNLGVRLEYREDGPAVIKLVDRDVLMKEREEKKEMAEKKRKEKEARKAAAAAASAPIDPKEMFRLQTDKYSEWDEDGFPTLDMEGKEISKGHIKKLQKMFQAQVKKYNEWVKAQHKGVLESTKENTEQ